MAALPVSFAVGCEGELVGVAGSGGGGTGGRPGDAGGSSAAAGSAATGGASPGSGAGTDATGGGKTGGAATQGGAGADANGGKEAGGVATDGASAGGAVAAGTEPGGAASGGQGTGGALAGGGEAGGEEIGGAEIGGTVTGGVPTGGAPTGGSPTGGSGGCIEDSTRYECAVGREVCRDGTWIGDRSCYRAACAIVDCGDGTSTCCEGWGRVGVEGYTYVVNDSLVRTFTQTSNPLGVEATFQFNLDYDIGAVSLFLDPPRAWQSITSAIVTLGVDGDPFPTLEISFEEQGTDRGGVWWLDGYGGGVHATPLNLYGPSLYCFSAGCPTQIDLINIRVRPIGVESGGHTGDARLAVESVVLTFD